MSLLSTIVQTTVTANQADAFERIVPIDLTSIFTGDGPLPSVTGTQKPMSGIARETKFNDEFMEYQILSPC